MFDLDLVESIYLKCSHKMFFFTILRLMCCHVTFAIHDRGIFWCEYAAEGPAFGNSVYWIQFDEEFSQKVSLFFIVPGACSLPLCSNLTSSLLYGSEI